MTKLSSAVDGWRRTHSCGELSAKEEGQEVTLMGWVKKRRDLGQLIFVDLRDRFGTTQIVFDPNINPQTHESGADLKLEYVIGLKGTVKTRPEGMINDDMVTGAVEVHVSELKVFNSCQTLPFQLDEKSEAGENLRLQYRYLDLRREEAQRHILTRAKVVGAFRQQLDGLDFVDVETPYLYKSTPEGAREFLVPSRVHAGEFYALPQSPQLFKQVLMVGGFDRYYQIVKCFRDEDMRADRQPEFSQVDCEMSFVDREMVLETFSNVVANVVRDSVGKEITLPLPRLTWQQAMDEYGCDKPDTRFDMKLKDLTEILKSCDFKVFAQVANSGGKIKAIVVKGQAEAFSRKKVDELTDLAKKHGASGLAWAKYLGDEAPEAWKSPILKFLGTELLDQIAAETGATAQDLILFAAGTNDQVYAPLAALRNHLGKELGLIDEYKLNFLWVTDFPLLEHDKESDRWLACHHPFTQPRVEDMDKLESDPGSVKADAYDLVLNGYEVAGGSIRIHDPEVQETVFKAIGIGEEERQKKFGFLLDALKYGAPPHGGLAFGLDRICMILSGTDAIRDVIAFPKTLKATCLMTGAPTQVPDSDLTTLHIQLKDVERPDKP